MVTSRWSWFSESGVPLPIITIFNEPRAAISVASETAPRGVAFGAQVLGIWIGQPNSAGDGSVSRVVDDVHPLGARVKIGCALPGRGCTGDWRGSAGDLVTIHNESEVTSGDSGQNKSDLGISGRGHERDFGSGDCRGDLHARSGATASMIVPKRE